MTKRTQLSFETDVKPNDGTRADGQPVGGFVGVHRPTNTIVWAKTHSGVIQRLKHVLKANNNTTRSA